MVGARPSDLGKSSCVTASYEPAVRFSRTESAAAAPLASPLQSGGKSLPGPTGRHCPCGWAQAGGGTGGEGAESVLALSQQGPLPPLNKPELRQSQG